MLNSSLKSYNVNLDISTHTKFDWNISIISQNTKALNSACWFDKNKSHAQIKIQNANPSHAE